MTTLTSEKGHLSKALKISLPGGKIFCVEYSDFTKLTRDPKYGFSNSSLSMAAQEGSILTFMQ